MSFPLMGIAEDDLSQGNVQVNSEKPLGYFNLKKKNREPANGFPMFYTI